MIVKPFLSFIENRQTLFSWIILQWLVRTLDTIYPCLCSSVLFCEVRTSVKKALVLISSLQGWKPGTHTYPAGSGAGGDKSFTVSIRNTEEIQKSCLPVKLFQPLCYITQDINVSQCAEGATVLGTGRWLSCMAFEEIPKAAMQDSVTRKPHISISI